MLANYYKKTAIDTEDTRDIHSYKEGDTEQL
jgi:hypothetical protein